jgi:hypothetical protein
LETFEPPNVISKEAFDELVQRRHTSTRTARLAILLAVVSFAYGTVLLALVFAHAA